MVSMLTRRMAELEAENARLKEQVRETMDRRGHDEVERSGVVGGVCV